MLDNEEKFAAFLLRMQDDVEDLIEEAEEAGYTLDYSLASLAELERYLLDYNVQFDDPSESALLRRSKCWEYLGEVVRQNFGGRWLLSDNEDNSANQGLFVIEGHCAVAGVEYVPIRQVQVFVQRRQPGQLLRSIQNHVNPTRSVLDSRPTEF